MPAEERVKKRMHPPYHTVMPAKAGIQEAAETPGSGGYWVPAFAGTTVSFARIRFFTRSSAGMTEKIPDSPTRNSFRGNDDTTGTIDNDGS